MYTNRYGIGRARTGRLQPYEVEAVCKVCKVVAARSPEEAEDIFYEIAGVVEDSFPEGVFEILSVREGE